VQLPKNTLLVGGEKLAEGKRHWVDELLNKYPGLKMYYWTKEKIRG
jgi:hypothetical protein